VDSKKCGVDNVIAQSSTPANAGGKQPLSPLGPAILGEADEDAWSAGALTRLRPWQLEQQQQQPLQELDGGVTAPESGTTSFEDKPSPQAAG
jgi:hypothetical protein